MVVRFILVSVDKNETAPLKIFNSFSVFSKLLCDTLHHIYEEDSRIIDCQINIFSRSATIK
jgi:hypothetical protein